MTVIKGTNTESGRRKIEDMSSTEARAAIILHLFDASVKSSFLIGFLIFPALLLISGVHFHLSDMPFLLGGLPIMALGIGIAAILVGPTLSYPAIMIGGALWAFMHQRKIKGVGSLFLVAAATSFLYGEILKFPLRDAFSTFGVMFEFFSPLGGFLTAIIAYPSLRDMGAVEDIGSHRKSILYLIISAIGSLSRNLGTVVIALFAVFFVAVLIFDFVETPYKKITVAGETFQLARKHFPRRDDNISNEIFFRPVDIGSPPTRIDDFMDENSPEVIRIWIFEDTKEHPHNSGDMPEHLIKNKEVSSQKIIGMSYKGSTEYTHYFQLDDGGVSFCSIMKNGSISFCRATFKLDDKVAIEMEVRAKDFSTLTQNIKSVKQILNNAKIPRSRSG